MPNRQRERHQMSHPRQTTSIPRPQLVTVLFLKSHLLWLHVKLHLERTQSAEITSKAIPPSKVFQNVRLLEGDILEHVEGMVVHQRHCVTTGAKRVGQGDFEETPRCKDISKTHHPTQIYQTKDGLYIKATLLIDTLSYCLPRQWTMPSNHGWHVPRFFDVDYIVGTQASREMARWMHPCH